MYEKISHGMYAAIFSLALGGVAHAQNTFDRTLTVDPSGNADFTKIQDAINDMVRIGNDPADRYTVLIYAGTYNENVTLPGTKENVDLVGVDRDSVIIAPTSAGSGIKITSGTETSRNNRIANLTIKTSNGHGIEIVKGTATPKDIVIEGVTIGANGTSPDKHGILGTDADTVRIFDCNITSQKGSAINRGKNFDIVHTVLSPVESNRDGAIRSGKKGAGSSPSDITGR